MGEAQNSSSEEQKQSADNKTQIAATAGEMMRAIEHEGRRFINNIAMRSQLVQMSPDNPAMVTEAMEKIKSEATELGTMLKEAAERELYDEHPLETVYEWLSDALEKLCSSQQELKVPCVVEYSNEWPPKLNRERTEQTPLKLVLHALPENLKRYNIRSSPGALQLFLTNLLSNSVRKETREFHVSIVETGYHEVSLIISDDGKGMKRKMLEATRSGKFRTDKEGEDIEPGRDVTDHGIGLKGVHKTAAKCEAKIFISSKLHSSIHDTGGFDVDEQSMREHPFDHGTTFRFAFPVHTKRINGPNTFLDADSDNEAAPSQIDQAQHSTASQIDTADAVPEFAPIRATEPAHHSRRETLVTLGIAAGIGVLGTTLFMQSRKTKKEIATTLTNPESPISPLSNFIFDPNNQLLSFEFGMGKEKTMWKAGDKLPPGLVDVRQLPFGDSSVTAIVLAGMDNRIPQTTFMVGTPFGTFASVKVPDGNRWKTAFALGPRLPKSLQPQLLHDTVLHYDESQKKHVFDATNMKVLESSRFKAMAPILKKIAAEIDPSDDTGGTAFDNFRQTILNATFFRDGLEEHPVPARDIAELRRVIEEQKKELFIIPEPRVVDELRKDKLKLIVPIKQIVEEKKSLCLKNVWSNEVNAIVEMV